MSFRLACYAVCLEKDRLLLVRHVSNTWTLPGGKVEHAEDPFDTVTREVAEETGFDAVAERLLGVDSRVIPAAERAVPGGAEHHNIGIFYKVRIVGAKPLHVPDRDTTSVEWTSISDVAGLYRSSLVDVGLALVLTTPANGHVASVTIGGLVQH